MKLLDLKHIIYQILNEEDTPQDASSPETPPEDQPQTTPEPTPQEEPTPETPVISRDQAKEIIQTTKGKVFTVSFVKKDGTNRVMNARLGVKVFLKGGTLPYNPDSKNLIPVYDMKNRGYRMINVNTINNLKIGNIEYSVKSI